MPSTSCLLLCSAHISGPPNKKEDDASPQYNQDKFAHQQTLFSESTHLVPLFVFDEREIELSGLPKYQRKGPEARTKEFGFWKTGVFRAR